MSVEIRGYHEKIKELQNTDSDQCSVVDDAYVSPKQSTSQLGPTVRLNPVGTTIQTDENPRLDEIEKQIASILNKINALTNRYVLVLSPLHLRHLSQGRHLHLKINQALSQNSSNGPLPAKMENPTTLRLNRHLGHPQNLAVTP